MATCICKQPGDPGCLCAARWCHWWSTRLDAPPCRYWGHFKDGKRHGYGVLYYATGARYEGWWVGDKKEGEGCFVFENGEVGSWEGKGAREGCMGSLGLPWDSMLVASRAVDTYNRQLKAQCGFMVAQYARSHMRTWHSLMGATYLCMCLPTMPHQTCMPRTRRAMPG